MRAGDRRVPAAARSRARAAGRRRRPARWSMAPAPARAAAPVCAAAGWPARSGHWRDVGVRRRSMANIGSAPTGCSSSSGTSSSAARSGFSARISWPILARRSTTRPSVSCMASSVSCVRTTSSRNASSAVSFAPGPRDCSMWPSKSASRRSMASNWPAAAGSRAFWMRSILSASEAGTASRTPRARGGRPVGGHRTPARRLARPHRAIARAGRERHGARSVARGRCRTHETLDAMQDTLGLVVDRLASIGHDIRAENPLRAAEDEVPLELLHPVGAEPILADAPTLAPEIPPMPAAPAIQPPRRPAPRRVPAPAPLTIEQGADADQPLEPGSGPPPARGNPAPASPPRRPRSAARCRQRRAPAIRASSPPPAAPRRPLRRSRTAGAAPDRRSPPTTRLRCAAR